MIELIHQGGPFMWPLTVLGLVVVAVALKKAADVFGGAEESAAHHRPMINVVLQAGIFSFFVGLLSQAVGLFQALQAIEAAGDVSPALIFGGLKVSLIAPIYGLFISLFSLAAWSVLKYRNETLDVEA